MKALKLFSLIQKRAFIIFICGIGILCLIFSSIGMILFKNGADTLLKLDESAEISQIINTSHSFINFGMLTGIFFLLLCAFIAIRLHIIPVQNILRTAQILTTKDGPAMYNALAELSQGNLATTLNLKSNTISETASPNYMPIINFMNAMIENFKRTAQEYNILTKVGCKRLCYVGTDSFIEGQKIGAYLGDLIEGEGDVVIITGFLASSGQTLRRNGFTTILHARYSKINILETIESHGDMERTFELTKDLLNRYPKLKGIYVTEGATPPAVARAVMSQHKKGEVQIVSHDLTNETMKFVQNNVISATLGQNPFGQGHDPVIHLFNHLTSDWEPFSPRLLVEPYLATSTNYIKYWSESSGNIPSEEIREKLAKPIRESSEEPLKIAVIGSDDSSSSFWTQIRDGVLAAKQELESGNVQVDWIVPKQKGKKSITRSELFRETLKSLVEQGYNGIACPVFMQDIIEDINNTVHQGIPVITYNSEPFSLRSLIGIILDQSNNLLEMSQVLASRIFEVNMVTGKVDDAMRNLSNGANFQMEQVDKTRENLNDLLISIDTVSSEAEASSKGSNDTSNAVVVSTEAMKRSFDTMKKFEESVSTTWQIVEALTEHSEKIDSIVDFITDIASRVNVLALNAAIEATQAGEQGKGFMIVAKEIRQLAGNASKATGEITELVNNIKIDINKVDKIMGDGLSKIKQTSKFNDEAGETLGSVQTLLEIDQDRLHTIVEAMSKMQNLSDEVGKAMNQVASISRKNTTTAEDVSSATNDMTKQLNVIEKSTKRFETIAKSEKNFLAKFVVN